MRLKVLIVSLIFLLLVPSAPALANEGMLPEGFRAPGDSAPPREMRPFGTRSAVEVAPGAWRKHDLALGEVFACLAQRSNIEWETLAKANRLLNPTVLAAGQTISLPTSASSTTFASTVDGNIPLLAALQYDISFWDILHLNPNPVPAGEGLLLPEAGTDLYHPYPLTALAFAPQPLVRGRTAVLALKTAIPATCEVTYLEQSEPCYTERGTHLYALIGLAPSVEPGTHEIIVHLQHDQGCTTFAIPMEVEAGYYARQWITPPLALQDLLNPEVYFGELESLEPLRGIRTPERYWQLPLAMPLNIQPSISADFGATRSYGGVFETYHSGIDIRAWTGVPILASAPGIVVMTDTLRVRGNAVIIDHGWGLMTGYWHLSRIDVQVGQYVEKGQTIGLAGNTGLSTGAHLHWEMWVNGVAVNGLQWVDEGSFDTTPFAAPARVMTGPSPKEALTLSTAQ